MKRTRSVEEEGLSDERSSLMRANVSMDMDSNLCDQCTKIDLEGTLNFPVVNISDTKGIWIADICQKHLSKHASTCSLCHILLCMLNENGAYSTTSLIPTTIGLRAFSIMRNLEEIDQWRVPVAIRSQLDNLILGLDLNQQVPSPRILAPTYKKS
jgi:hypothetical protein